LSRPSPVAQAAFAVGDEFRGRGTATRMLEQLADIAVERGIARFVAEVMTDNRAMLRICERTGFALRCTGAFGEVLISRDIRRTR
jgi:RimJ/RimL family protein N-acetyltransferase